LSTPLSLSSRKLKGYPKRDGKSKKTKKNPPSFLIQGSHLHNMSATPTAEKTQNSDMRRRTLVFLYFTLDRFFVSIENFEKDPSKKKIQRSLRPKRPSGKKKRIKNKD